MPSEALKSMADKHGVSISDAERYWDEAVDSAEKKGKTGDDKYRYAMGIVKKRMGITSAAAEEIIATLVKNKGVNLMKNAGKQTILAGIKPDIKDLRVLASGASADTIDKIIAYESGELEDEDVVALFADLIKTGMAWQLQGSYGRQAKQFIDAGTISRRGEILQTDF